jgi:hypothetical protein
MAVSSRLRSSQAASCTDPQATASIRATWATIRVRCRRPRRSDQYDPTRDRRAVARPTYSTRPPASRNR